MEAYEQLLALGRERAGISTATAQPARVLHAAGKAQAELTAQANAEGILSAEEAEKRIDALNQLELACAPIQQDIDKGQAQFAKLEAETQKALDRADINKMEQDLWIYGIHSLAMEERREVLKNSALQERFMGIGLAGGEASRLREKTSAFESPGAPDVAGATEDEYRLLQLVGGRAPLPAISSPMAGSTRTAPKSWPTPSPGSCRRERPSGALAPRRPTSATAAPSKSTA